MTVAMPTPIASARGRVRVGSRISPPILAMSQKPPNEKKAPRIPLARPATRGAYPARAARRSKPYDDNRAEKENLHEREATHHAPSDPHAERAEERQDQNQRHRHQFFPDRIERHKRRRVVAEPGRQRGGEPRIHDEQALPAV